MWHRVIATTLQPDLALTSPYGSSGFLESFDAALSMNQAKFDATSHGKPPMPYLDSSSISRSDKVSEGSNITDGIGGA